MATNKELRERVAGAMFAWQNNMSIWRNLASHHQEQWLGYADAVLAELAPELRHEPPEGCPRHYEAVWLPPETVDFYASHGLGSITDACRATVAARSQPVVKTERVPWWEAVGRRLVEPLNGADYVVRVERDVNAWPSLHLDDGQMLHEDSADGAVEVLIEDPS
jgi:hypothetical protein